MKDDFYRSFEDRHRGSRDVINERLNVYLPFVDSLSKYYPNEPVLDLGCGRGEWLELMLEKCFAPFGVDLDDGMLDECRERGLPAHKGDAIAFLKGLPNESQVVVSAFHVVEHITFEQLQSVVSESLRVLKPGGLLIMETPNPENISVGTRSFYLDPTHQRPIPDLLLSFVAEYYGFARVKTLRLQENKSLKKSNSLSLVDVLTGVSPDYAVIAQKAASDDVMHMTSQPFEKDYGVTLNELAATYDLQISKKIEQAESVAQAANAQLYAVLASRSWQITKPLRWCGLQARRLRDEGFVSRAKALVKKIGRPVVKRAMEFVNARPVLRKNIIELINRLGLYERIRRRYWILQGKTHKVSPLVIGRSFVNEFSDLSPRARQIYADLKIEIKKYKENC
ncbi:class I SAM-dependent methyltransferase [Crenobacter sp. SG2303]|uniref:Class I SAM-dependent methyltransferase n=1 Tax=Crenobacter oryzisoli TaxID=3056844 RepID=A0ABT7XSS3_9NEIS|nr:class I SAM-dependent methyltransferase [Crenobacter sp. SG2303]MDN0076842.1 class I SAM-dependent methyltransferase [Crenobacter sp. SG2303]